MPDIHKPQPNLFGARVGVPLTNADQSTFHITSLPGSQTAGGQPRTFDLQRVIVPGQHPMFQSSPASDIVDARTHLGASKQGLGEGVNSNIPRTDDNPIGLGEGEAVNPEPGGGRTEPHGGETRLKICGPDVTQFMLAEIQGLTNAFFDWMKRMSPTPALKRRVLTVFGRGLPWSYLSFSSDKCPFDCPNTVTLCDVCIPISQLNNIGFGAIASYLFGTSAALNGARRVGKDPSSVTGMRNASDAAAVLAGAQLGSVLAHGHGAMARGTAFCDALRKNPIEDKNAFTEGAGNGTIKAWLGEIGHPMQVIKVQCPTCPDVIPPAKHKPRFFTDLPFPWTPTDVEGFLRPVNDELNAWYILKSFGSDYHKHEVGDDSDFKGVDDSELQAEVDERASELDGRSRYDDGHDHGHE